MLSTPFSLNLDTFSGANVDTKKRKMALKKKFGQPDIDELEAFFKDHLVMPSYVTKRNDSILQFASHSLPITYWVDHTLYSKLKKLGREAGLPKEILLKLNVGLANSLLDLNSEVEFLKYLDDFFISQDGLLEGYLPKWKKILKTKDSRSTLEAIDKVLKGRRKIPT